jgi:hypothetical protein
MDTQTNFEEWAKLLLTRKVPQNFSHLINSEVIHSGADILKRGDAFEVHLETPSHESARMTDYSPSAGAHIFVTPIPHVTRAFTH